MRILMSTVSLFLIGIFNSFNAQMDKFIEVSVHESIENPVDKVNLYFNVKSAEYQYYNTFEEEEYYFEEESLYDNYPDTYIDESLSAKQKKKREAEIEKAMEEWEKWYQQQDTVMFVERQKRESERKVFTSAEAMEILREYGYSAVIVNESFPTSMYEEGGGSDTVLVIEILKSEDYDRLSELFDPNVVSYSVKEIFYKKNEDALAEIFPKLLASAEKQAKVIAAASGKKIGSASQITNVYPGFSPSIMERQMDEARRIGSYYRHDNELDNPYLKKEKVLFEYVFRFPILN